MTGLWLRLVGALLFSLKREAVDAVVKNCFFNDLARKTEACENWGYSLSTAF